MTSGATTRSSPSTIRSTRTTGTSPSCRPTVPRSRNASYSGSYCHSIRRGNSKAHRPPTPYTAKALRPPAGCQVRPTRLVVPELGLELLQRLREVGPTHVATLLMVAFGVNPVG